MTQAGKAVIDQQEETDAGASGDDLGAPFSLSVLCEERIYSPPPLTGGGMVCGHHALRGTGAAPLTVLTCRYIQQTPTADCASDATAPIAGGLRASATNKRHKVYICELLATTISDYRWGLNVIPIGGILGS